MTATESIQEAMNKYQICNPAVLVSPKTLNELKTSIMYRVVNKEVSEYSTIYGMNIYCSKYLPPNVDFYIMEEEQIKRIIKEEQEIEKLLGRKHK